MKAVSMISGLRGNTYLEKLKELDLETLQKRRENLDMTQAFKIINGLDKIESDSLFNHLRRGEGPGTRMAASGKNLVVPRARLDVRKNFYTVRAADSWNKLGENMKDKKTVQSFKHALRS